jgi:hypothetical protein
MPHVDEGTLHALLDGELAPAEVQQVQTHFATCPACQARLDEARHMMEETERLLKALEPQGARQAAEAANPPAPRVFVPPPPASGTDGEGGDDSLDPFVLIPDNPHPGEVRRHRLRTLAWAAGLLVAVGAGGFAVKAGLMSSKPEGELRIRPEDFERTPPVSRALQAAAPLAGGAQADSGTAVATSPAANAAAPAADRAAQQPAAPAPTAPGPAPAATVPAASNGNPANGAPADRPAAKPSDAPAAEQKSAAAPPPAAPAGTGSAAPADASTRRAADARAAEPVAAKSAPPARAAASAPVPAQPRQSSDAAMRALDRQKAEEASARELAALDAERKARAASATDRTTAAAPAAAAPAAPAGAQTQASGSQPADSTPPAPQPPTLEQRAQITSRIGLDEAARQLGGPLHAIDAADYTRQFVGIVSGASVPGADPNRPVVRAVYVDRSGRLIYLDQQRVQPGQGGDLPSAPPAGAGDPRWVRGTTFLRLHGERSGQALDSLARRVR